METNQQELLDAIARLEYVISDKKYSNESRKEAMDEALDLREDLTDVDGLLDFNEFDLGEIYLDGVGNEYARHIDGYSAAEGVRWTDGADGDFLKVSEIPTKIFKKVAKRVLEAVSK